MSISTPHRYALDQIDGPRTQTAGLLYEGTKNDDDQTGSAGDDTFNYGQGGNDTLHGGNGNDTFNLGNAFNSTFNNPDQSDQIDGGDGYDRLVLNGDYLQFTTQLNDSSLQNIEEIDFKPGHSYAFDMTDETVKAGGAMVIDGSALRSGDRMIIGADTESDGAYTVYGGKSNDQVIVGAGSAHVYGGANFDLVSLPANSLDNKIVTGGAGSDTLDLRFSGSGDVAFNPDTMSGFEALRLVTGFNFGDVTLSVTMDDANLAAGAVLQVTVLDFTDTRSELFFSGQAELDGRFDIFGQPNDDALRGGQQNDTFHIDNGGDDLVLGQNGDDTIYAGAAYDTDDAIDGEAGKDTLVLNGDYSSVTPATFTNIEILRLTAGHSYSLSFFDEVIADGQKLTIDGAHLGSGNVLTIDGTAETDGSYIVTGGAAADSLSSGAKSDRLTGNGGNDALNGGGGDDTLYGGAGNDSLTGLGGADRLVLGDGRDVVDTAAVDQSTGRSFDTVAGFDFANNDSFALGQSVSKVDAKITGGALSNGNFNADLAAAVTAARLGAHHAVLFTPSGSGPYAGDTFLIVDANGNAGYQANQDYVFLLTDALHTNQLSASDFTLAD